jgi:DNA replication protein DnaC
MSAARSWLPPTCPSTDEWTEVFGSERLTGALLDRLTHHVNILEMNGESYRLMQSRQAGTVLLQDDDLQDS